MAKPEHAAAAKSLFQPTGVEVCSDGAKDSGDEPIAEGARHLGAAIGSSAFKSSFVEKKVKVWVQQVKDLAEVALTEPHAAFAVFTHCLQGRWTFLSRSMPNLSTLFEPLEDAIYRVFLSSLLRRDITRLERNIISLPARFGGLGIFNPATDCDRSHLDSKTLSEPLVTLVGRQDGALCPGELADEVKVIRKELEAERVQRHLDSSRPCEVSLCYYARMPEDF